MNSQKKKIVFNVSDNIRNSLEYSVRHDSGSDGNFTDEESNVLEENGP